MSGVRLLLLGTAMGSKAQPCQYGKYSDRDNGCVDNPAIQDCPHGEYWTGSYCQPDPNPRACPHGQYWDVHGCSKIPMQACKHGWSWTGSYCEKNPPPPEDTGHSSCKAHQYWDGTQCAGVIRSEL
jgi:hypothetical protein